MIVGQSICDVCGVDCTKLHGFIMVRRQQVSPQQEEAFTKVKKEFGKTDFVVCWSCTVKAFGIKTLAEKDVEKQKLEKEKTNGGDDR